ncbi:hypothetical protein HK101_006221 [Irineochytrium annulatum]|nr:hypothetical protein HK101_006221 [Irineochytrium annulatum]
MAANSHFFEDLFPNSGTSAGNGNGGQNGGGSGGLMLAQNGDPGLMSMADRLEQLLASEEDQRGAGSLAEIDSDHFYSAMQLDDHHIVGNGNGEQANGGGADTTAPYLSLELEALLKQEPPPPQSYDPYGQNGNIVVPMPLMSAGNGQSNISYLEEMTAITPASPGMMGASIPRPSSAAGYVIRSTPAA